MENINKNENITDDKYKNVNLDFGLIDLIINNPFFAELSRNIRKSKDLNIPTIGVGFDEEKDEFVMYYNPEFISTLSKKQLKNVLIHEFYHIIFEHISTRKKKPHKIWNIATDLAINSIIISQNKQYNYYDTKDESLDFPNGAFAPGDDFLVYNPESDEKFKTFFSTLKKLETSEYYYEKVIEFMKENTDGSGENEEGENSENQMGENGSGLPKSFDSHDKWSESLSSNKQLVKQKIQKILEKAAIAAEKNGWGNIPSEIRQQVKQVISSENRINWKDVLRNFISNVSASSRRTSIKRINRKYPYTHPGTLKNRVPRILVALDESGSISNEEISLFFDELSNLTKLVNVDVIPFDTHVNPDHLIHWRKGQKIEPIRNLNGGTDFNAPTDFANSEENRGKWDAMIIFTDGVAQQPRESRVKRAWVIIPGYKLIFSTNEIVISIEKNN